MTVRYYEVRPRGLKDKIRQRNQADIIIGLAALLAIWYWIGNIYGAYEIFYWLAPIPAWLVYKIRKATNTTTHEYQNVLDRLKL